MLLWLHLYLWLCLSLFLKSTSAQTCSSSSPCAEGCCNKWGNCGFGPDYCGHDCISDCGRKSQCNPGYGAKWSQKDKCPLNVCCSKHGYCGTTKLFCGDKKVSHKTCSKTNGNTRIIGYFEGWASNRPCNVFWPEQIPVGLYTHINFAFATIDPVSFKVLPVSDNDVALYKRLTHLKQKDPDLRVFIAIGGWTFNDPGPTATTFSDLAASVPRQKAFIESLVSFMSTYGFDGVDLDWEYPAAKDRSGREVDFSNFPKFMSRLKSALDTAKKGISITLPASYWYLQNFDIVELAKSVSWFNIMSYDLHGTWDKGNEWTGAYLNAHTNLTEIDQALDLLWRNNISPDKVVMGLGFYGRAFTTTSPSCLEPGCTYESGATKGKCSREVGILLNSEIDDLVKEHGVKPKLYKKEAVKVASWGNPTQWVAFDDEETFQLKSEYAQSRCLGGLMVWAISHDTKDSKYNKALAKVANRKIKALSIRDGSDAPYSFVDIPNDQCKWTNCNEGCPSGWVLMTREDPGKRGKEYMFDQTGCGGIGSHAFCCPPGQKLPTCGWYTHHNGKCDGTCPKGMGYVGSNNMYCNNGGFQAACCTQDTKSIKLYTLCELGAFPFCDTQTGCPSKSGDQSRKTLLTSSSTGMGGAEVNVSTAGGGWPGGYSRGGERKFCCDTSNKKMTFSDCEWYSGLGFGPADGGDDFCRPNCPNNRVRVAMDTGAKECSGGGKASCCLPNYSDTIEVENDKLGVWRDELKRWLNDPTCAKPGAIISRRYNHANSNSQSLFRRATNPGEAKTESLLLALVTKVGTQAMLEAMEKVWNDGTGNKFPHFKMPGFRDYITNLPNYGTEGPMELCHDIMCSPYYWDARASKGKTKTVDCVDGICTSIDSCDLDETDAGVAKRNVNAELDGAKYRDIEWMYRGGNNAHDAQLDENGALISPNMRRFMNLEKRITGARPFTASLTSPSGERAAIIITLPGYYNFDDYPSDDPLMDEVVDFASRGDCTNTRIIHLSLPNGETFQIEHLFDGNVMARFMSDAAAGRLRSGAVARAGPVSISFFRQARTMPLLPNAPPLPGGADYSSLYPRVMDCLGSFTNTETFVGAHRDINAVKTNLMRGHNPIATSRWQRLATNAAAPEYVLLRLRASIGVIRYLNHRGTPNINGRLAIIINNVGIQWDHGAATWNAANPNNRVAIGDLWREWAPDFFAYLVLHTQNFVRNGITQMRNYWGVSTSPLTDQVLEILRDLEDQLGDLEINTDDFDT
ncbi:hypothetical protein PFICI_12256 [Pestalotiopsis fici W106-1]|uniref:chitinase n=1 Tax=Pestalotiopsis fici (strain W106-1 / CGMCC3.15140) TaxID=1229662 RepID=W3WQA2_PESFW|nr:uncharacterized protein PFICI_12256 [Pestalotiopsis fici W106-1]ETS75312.1 hypothetical protein PFICI_12256 [Pestalotiopsis fici W106-1]